jgi:hypothetical protein
MTGGITVNNPQILSSTQCSHAKDAGLGDLVYEYLHEDAKKPGPPIAQSV